MVETTKFKPPNKNQFSVLAAGSGQLALWKVGAIEDDSLFWVVCGADGQQLAPGTYSKARAELAFKNIGLILTGVTWTGQTDEVIPLDEHWEYADQVVVDSRVHHGTDEGDADADTTAA